MEYIPGSEPAKTSGNIIIISDLKGLEKAGTKKSDNWEKSKNND